MLSCLELQKDEYLAYLTVEFFIWQEANQRTLHWRLNCWVGPIKSVSKKKEREIQNPNNLYKTKQTLLRDHFFSWNQFHENFVKFKCSFFFVQNSLYFVPARATRFLRIPMCIAVCSYNTDALKLFDRAFTKLTL